MNGELTEAEANLKDALRADILYGPAHNNLGKVYYHQGKLYLAAWEFQYAIKLMPHAAEPKNNLGLVYERAGKLEEASEEYGKALALEPERVELMGNLARARIRSGEKGEEIRTLLSDLVLRDTRPEWVEWAREQLSRNASKTTK